ncbi:metal-dependent transcriptional regulator [Erysipelothrix urinaevulpis]|uniref:metal-dependent transcriptional regulator n=1 Tax=Erysipelothrix urinaevulpis TaxID=2683717 RepID=UPI001F417A4E|nr:metal-dependent transcriptional regulator [Erysipelothrix urinaevulpis]
MMTPSREDYIKAIFKHNEKGTKLNNKDLSENLSVSAASTSEMIRKLIDTGHVDRDKTMGLMLTEEGKNEAKDLVKKHRLWEVFLVNHLGYSWTEVHDDAEVLEHVTSSKLADRLNEFLDEPKHCPHGEIIFGNSEEVDDSTVSLASLTIDDHGTFQKVSDTGELLEYLEVIKFKLNDDFKVVKKLPYEGPIVVEVNGLEVSISYHAAQEIFVLKHH